MNRFPRVSVRSSIKRRMTVASLLAGLTMGFVPATAPATAQGATRAAQPLTAAEQAAATGKPVEVEEARDEYSTTYVNPDGTYRLDQAVSPVRVQDRTGNWHAPDATLERRADGSVGPRYSVVDMSFSGGGAAPMVTLRSLDRTVRIDFPGSLPEPVLNGADATYPDVFPDVDLKVIASTSGFRQVLVVKTRTAGRNPALRELSFAVHTSGLTVRGSVSGGFEATDANGAAVFSGPAGIMWDSGLASASSPSALLPAVMPAGGSADGPRAHGPTGWSRVAAVRTRVSSRSVNLAPNAAWLDDAATTYPVYVDPTIGATAGGYTVIRNDGWEDWKFAGDEGVGMCGSLTISGITYVCGSGYVQRQAFKFNNTNLVGKYVLDAAFRIRETWSFTCTPSVTQLHRLSSGITTSTSWPGPSIVDMVADETFSAGRGTACSPEQPDKDIEFADDSGDTSDNLTSMTKNLADGTWSSVSLELRNSQETDAADWKRFNGSTAVLQVTYAVKPGTPTSPGVKATSSSTISCGASSSPTTVTSLTPTLGATLQAEKTPATTDEKGFLSGQFQVMTSTGTTAVWDSGAATANWHTDGYQMMLPVPSGKLAEGIVYRMRARTQSHYTDPSTGNLYSGYSGWCYFRAALNAPKASTILADTNPANGVSYALCQPDCAAAGGPGMAGRFKITNPMTTVTSFQWTLVQPGSNGSPSRTVDQGTATATASAGLMTSYIQPTPQLDGVQQLNVVALNGTLVGETATESFRVALGSLPVGEWRVEDPASPVVDTSGGSHDLILQAGAAVSALGRSAANVVGDGALDFVNSGGAVTTGPVINTAGSFSVSAWAYLKDAGSVAHIVASQASASPLAGFQLYYSGATGRWRFGVTAPGAMQGSSVVAVSTATAAPVPYAWTHLTGVYDAAGKTVELFVNGVSQGKSAVTVQPGSTTGAFMVGRDEMGSASEPFYGQIDQVRAWNRGITASEVIREAQGYSTDGSTAAALVGFWNPSSSDGSLADLAGYGRTALSLAGGATAIPNGGLLVNGTTAGAFTPGGLVDENASFTVSAKVHGMTNKTGRGRVVSQEDSGSTSGATWSLYYDYSTTQWKFERIGLNSAGTTVTAVASSGPMPVNSGDLVVTGVYDADKGTVELLTSIAPACGGQCLQQHFVSGQGTGYLDVGTLFPKGTAQDGFAGTVDWVRVWAGAMTPNNLAGVIFQ